MLSNIDVTIRRGASEVLNVDFDDAGWSQATLLISCVGLSLRAASLHGSPPLVESFLHSTLECPLTHEIDSVAASWAEAGHTIPQVPARQKNWDSMSCERSLTGLPDSVDQRRRACLEAARQPHSGDWLAAIPSSATGTLLDDDCLRFQSMRTLPLQMRENGGCL